MIEKRSGDVDVLETQMRRLRLGSVGTNGTPGPRSREGSPFVTPQRRSLLWLLVRRREEMGRETEMGNGEGDEKKELEGRKD